MNELYKEIWVKKSSTFVLKEASNFTKKAEELLFKFSLNFDLYRNKTIV